MNLNELMPSTASWESMQVQARDLISSGFLPAAIKTPSQFLAIVLKGNELGIPPMQSLSHIHIISGKPTMSAELMLAQVFRLHPKTKLSYLKRDNETCEMKVTREGSDASIFKFTLDDAKTAGVMGNPVWKKYPRAMLHARCVSEMARSLFPDAISGVSYTPEEIGANINEDGEIIDIEQTAKKIVMETPVVNVLEEVNPTDTPNAAAPVAFTGKPDQVKLLTNFLTQRKLLALFNAVAESLVGKDFTKTNIEEGINIALTASVKS